ncbi:phospholipase A2-like isoform X2 [Mixophyes fleayi]|uniref:phospholipase A2-like isoform X2 n=1 Tax=Mixophyes fleayi TaxID=3061075 RepID=UPI003F4D99C7
MERKILLLFFLCNTLNGELGKTYTRQKRGLFELAGVIGCGTGKSSLLYVGYGCYCGLGGRGTPVDSSDRCCQKHDCCYGDAQHGGCKTMTNGYSWSCSNRFIKCDYTKDWCQRKLCRCDKELAICLRKTRYNAKYALYPNFLCGSKTQSC